MIFTIYTILALAGSVFCTSPNISLSTVNSGSTISSVYTAHSELSTSLKSMLVSSAFLQTTTHIVSSTGSIKPSSVLSSNATHQVSSSPVPQPTITPKPDPTSLHINFPEDKNKTCIKIDSNIELQFNSSMSIWLMQNDSVSGVCGNNSLNSSESHVTLTHNDTLINSQIVFTMNFKKSITDWQLVNITVEKDNITWKVDANLLTVPLNTSYSCADQQKFELTSTDKSQVHVVFKSLQLQPFLFNATYGKETRCSKSNTQNKTSSVVPIAVGGALAGLIVIVLVAYLIGRRRGNRGYQKV